MADKLTRRDVLRGSAAAVAGMAFTGAMAKEAPQRRSTGERLRVGVIGCGGKGWSGMQWAAESTNIVAICDVDASYRSRGMLEHPKANTFEDYRHMIESMKNEMDAVVISTPDHHHAIASALSMKAGLHCYCEKPLTRTIWDARQLARIARKNNVATQMGNQSTANTPMRKAAALIRNGEFGVVKEVHLWTDRAGGWWKQGMERPEPKNEIPKTLDWDIWLGPAPKRPYAEGYHPFAWRGFWDFGTGSLGDMGCHIFNMPFMALDLRDPLSVQAKTSGHNRESFPEWVEVHYEFGANLAGRPALDVFWYDGGHKPAASLVPGEEYGGNGVIVVCEKATIYSPNSENNEFRIVGGGTMPDIEVDESPGHMEEFVRAALGGKPAVSNFPDYSGPLTETVLLGNLAIWADGPKVEWDAKTMTTKGTTEFDGLIRSKQDNGWSY